MDPYYCHRLGVGLPEYVDAVSLSFHIVVDLNVRATEQESTSTPAIQASGESHLRATTWPVIILVCEQLVKPSGLIIFIAYQHVWIAWQGGVVVWVLTTVLSNSTLLDETSHLPSFFLQPYRLMCTRPSTSNNLRNSIFQDLLQVGMDAVLNVQLR